MRKFIEKFYSMVYGEGEDSDTPNVTYKHKAVIFAISVVMFSVILILIVMDIWKRSDSF